MSQALTLMLLHFLLINPGYKHIHTHRLLPSLAPSLFPTARKNHILLSYPNVCSRLADQNINPRNTPKSPTLLHTHK
ncbi:hypothetical protein M6B38_393820 [Iris pallida]|uniref:Secreted protein n=1 Tax=Iris pallida TaxID=29817 RepID=A0AAX6EQ05_IRIPA|nr:hypothetical protein M6B38_175795 [Iris pallida]KAJ6806287.1 hypothetical protein M6B38_175800 [Iris pallida]KAJ6821130.1 hypothetical protein M6B38_393820 [Iris pallida]